MSDRGATSATMAVVALGVFLCIPSAAVGQVTLTEYSAGITPGSVPVSITTGGDGALWFTEANGPHIARITTAGVVTEYSTGITPGSILQGITRGPDSALWFTEYFGFRIGRAFAPELQGSPIPTLSWLGALLMAVLLAGVSVFLLRRA